MNKYNMPPGRIDFRRYIIMLNLLFTFLAILTGSIHASQGLVRLGHSTDFYLSNNINRLWIGQTYANFSYRSRTEGVNWHLTLSHSKPNSSLNWASQNSGTARLDDNWFSIEAPFSDEYTAIKLNLEVVRNFLHGGTSWRFRSKNRHDFAVNGKIGSAEILTIDLSYGRKYPIPSYIELLYNNSSNSEYYEFDGGKINLAAPAQVFDISIALNRIRNIRLIFTNHNSEFSPAGPESDYRYHATFDGTSRGEQFVLEYSLASKSKIVAEYRHSQIGMIIQTFYDQEIFGHFGNAKGDFNQTSLKLISPNWSAQLKLGKIEGELGGNINSWPFARGLAILLGDRRQLIGQANINWTQVSMNTKLLESRSWVLNGGFDILSLSPDISYKTWRPKLLGFGIEDYESGRLSVRRANLLCLKFNPIFRISNYAINISASQWIPISIKKYGSDGASSSESSSGIFDSFGGNKTRGGFALSAMISVDL